MRRAPDDSDNSIARSQTRGRGEGGGRARRDRSAMGNAVDSASEANARETFERSSRSTAELNLRV
jgi:hypothetical protein